jgi:hypothetical protein
MSDAKLLSEFEEALQAAEASTAQDYNRDYKNAAEIQKELNDRFLWPADDATRVALNSRLSKLAESSVTGQSTASPSSA